ncbi:MAG: DUF3426 domain-containing protein [Betaproteobacteria bacterium]
MALATKCPQCGVLFRVVADQLKLRGGLVRCGQCRAVFDAIGSLTYVDDSAVAPSRAAKEEAPAASPSPVSPADDAPATRPALGRATTLRISPVPPATLAGNLPPRGESSASTFDEPAVIRRRTRGSTVTHADGDGARGVDTTAGTQGRAPTLVRTHEAPESEPLEAPLDEGAEPIAGKPIESDAAAVAAEATDRPPSFTRPRRRQRRGFSIVYGGGAALLVLVAAIQLAVIFRGQLMIHWPQSRPLLTDLCGVLRCNVNWPMQADRLAVIGTELQAIPGTDALELSALVRNRADFRQSLPAIEVTLTDARNRPLARKVFTPADYLASAGEPTSRLQEGLAPGGDLSIRILFEARGLAPAGFLVYPFYL